MFSLPPARAMEAAMAGLVSRLRQLRHSDQAIAAHVRSTLVASLYASPRTLIIGALTSSTISATVAIVSGEALLIVCALAIAIVGVTRIANILRADGRPDSLPSPTGQGGRRKELAYSAGAICYSALLGLFGLLALVFTDDALLQLLAVTTVIGYAAGVAARNAGRPLIALSQLCLASLPLVIGLVVAGDLLRILLAVVIALFIIAMMDIALQIYDVILRAVVASRAMADLAAHNAAIARRDDLTGLSNRTAFREQFELQLQALRSGDFLLAVCWIDLDRFKEINDSHGHLAGNALLTGIAGQLQGAFPGSIVARLGGDEFAVIRMVQSRNEAADTARKVMDLVERPVHHAMRQLQVSASIGVAIAPADGGEADILLKNADLALYRAKEAGRRAIRFYEPVMDEKIERRRDLAAELQGALLRGEFHLQFQPIFALDGSKICSCEALLRWTNRQFGAVSPAEFIPIAEEDGLIVTIGNWVMMEACRTAGAWPDDVNIAVNLSPVQLRSAELPAVIVRALGSAQLPAHRLEIEITESILLDEVDTTLAALRALNAIGVRTTLDDFGTGYSSLSYLTRFPFQTMKIDRSFIEDLDRSPASVAIVQAIVDLATKLGMQTIAEGVETPAQLAQLRRTRCDAVQGYLMGYPMPASRVAALLAGMRINVSASSRNQDESRG
ncbi:EAL domain-containing protein [Croceicoccus sp. F390]|uniref:EAL domain-containing protein n=1 Tax=Croceicoccus esteveae TaxID=3075597 RepID=A0ABU2ZIV9_9SPHN|nr:EAL domain-containing protein [Croceicoccus sp. F390]MDT0575958.1 EAL domain-containing protein [Croceicoccus sp. F390]